MYKQKELIWLAGFIDADGCIRLSKGWKNKKGVNSFIPQVSVHNTCLVTLKKVEKILLDFENGANVSDKKRISKIHSPMFNISLLGIKRVYPFLRKIEPYLVTKRLEAKLLLRFIYLRIHAKNHNSPYGQEEFKIYYALKQLKHERHLRDYVPTIEEILNQDIVRTNAKALEEAEMSSRLTSEQRQTIGKNLVKYRWSKVRSKK